MTPWYVDPKLLMEIGLNGLILFYWPVFVISLFLAEPIGKRYCLTDRDFATVFNASKETQVYSFYVLIIFLVPSGAGLIGTIFQLTQ